MCPSATTLGRILLLCMKIKKEWEDYIHLFKHSCSKGRGGGDRNLAWGTRLGHLAGLGVGDLASAPDRGGAELMSVSVKELSFAAKCWHSCESPRRPPGG